MKMSRSPYIDHVVLTNKHSGKRTHKVQAFVIHHMAARWTGKRCAEYFRDTPNRQASANYCIGYDGDVALNVEEQNRAWTSSSNWADQRAITYELANLKTGHPWKISDATINKAIVMLAEQHKRYGIKRASYTGDKSGTLWRHDWFANTNCPGPYLGGKLAYMAREINKILDGGGSSSKPSSSTNVGKTLQLPASAETWKVYNPNGPYTTGNEIHSLTPKAFGGLSYEIKGNPAPNVYLIDTGVRGRVAIYAHTGIGASFSNKEQVSKPKPKPKGRKLHLPASAKTWRIYNVNGPYTKAHAIHQLTPSRYGGITYDILEDKGNHVYIINTGVKGRVAIYAHPSTGARIT